MKFLQLSRFYSCPLPQPQSIPFLSHIARNSEPTSNSSLFGTVNNRPTDLRHSGCDHLVMDWGGSEFLLPPDVEEFRSEKNVKPEKVNYFVVFVVATRWSNFVEGRVA